MVPLRGNLCPCAYVISPLVVVVIYLLSYWNIFSHADFYLKAKFDYARSRATHHAVFMEALGKTLQLLWFVALSWHILPTLH